jgi:glycosyl transferase, family 25
MSIPCFVVTLEPKGERARSLVRAFGEQGLDATLFPAVDGRFGMPERMPQECLDQESAIYRRKAALSASEVGCYLSHLRVIRQAFDGNAHRVAVFEDDIGLEKGLKGVLSAIESLPEDVEFIRLMALRIRRRKVVGELDDHHVLTRPLRGVMGTQGYVVSRRGMEKIIRHGSRLDRSIDIFFDTFWETDLRSFCVEPHAIYELDHASSIVKAAKKATSVPWVARIGWRVRKPLKSLRRLLYLMQHRGEFYPNELPDGRPGKTERMW